MLSTRFNRIRGIVVFALILGASAGACQAQFNWTGTAVTSDWYAVDTYSTVYHVGPPEHWHYYMRNNWDVYWESSPSPVIPDSVFPQAADNVTIASNGPVWLSSPASILGLTVGDTLQIASTLTVGGNVSHSGTIEVGAGLSAGTLRFANSGSLSGAGTFQLNFAGILEAAGGTVVTNSVGHTIQGEGRIDAPLINQGTVLGNSLYGAVTNTGAIQSDAFHPVAIYSAVTQSGGGQIRAEGPFGNMVSIGSGGSVNGGAIVASGNGMVLIEGGSISNCTVTASGSAGVFSNGGQISDSSIAGQWSLNGGVTALGSGVSSSATMFVNGGDVGLASTLVNNGAITVGSSSPAAFSVADGAVFSGNGKVSLDAHGSLSAAVGTPQVINAANHTLEGAGGSITADVTLVNHGLLTTAVNSSLNVYGTYAPAADSTTRPNGGILTFDQPVTFRGILTGTGIVLGDLTLTADTFLRPGNSPDTLTVVGELALQSGAAYDWETNGTRNDLVDVNGTLDFTGAQITVNVALLEGAALPSSITLFEYDTLAGLISRDQIVLSGGLVYGGLDLSNGRVTLTGVAPEPGSLALLGIGVLAALRRRRNRT